MNANAPFLSVASLIGEPARAKMLWNLLDGRAYTAGELAAAADISSTSASNHLAKLLNASILKVEVQGRHRYYSFSRPEIAYVIESLATLVRRDVMLKEKEGLKPITYCRSCYDHLAGYVGVQITEAFEKAEWLASDASGYLVTSKGWRHLKHFGIEKYLLTNPRRSLCRQCLDWSERRPHLAGALGALLLAKMLENNWLRRVKFSRAIIITSKGQQQLQTLLGLNLAPAG
jgi:DNA-binding transcriptional ArsR family regulator